MKPEIFHIHVGSLNLPIYGYGLMMVIGFLLAAQLAKFLARRSGLDGEIFINAALLALVAGVVGARLSHILENLNDFTRSDRTVAENLWNMINLRSGGLTYYGGFLLGFPVLLAYGIWKKVPLRLGMDIVAPCLMIGLGLGRVGCFLNGCCYGAETHPGAFYAVEFPYNSNPYIDEVAHGEIKVPDALQNAEHRPVSVQSLNSEQKTIADQQHSLPLHPAQLYSTFTALLLAALLVAYFTIPHIPGRVFALMLILEGTTRFILEMLRSEPAIWGTQFSLSMFLGVFNVALGIGLWWLLGRLQSNPVPATVTAVAHPALARP